MARKAFLLRVDPKLLDSVQRWADAELRSLNGQIEFILREAVAKRGVKVPPAEPDPAPPYESDTGNAEPV